MTITSSYLNECMKIKKKAEFMSPSHAQNKDKEKANTQTINAFEKSCEKI